MALEHHSLLGPKSEEFRTNVPLPPLSQVYQFTCTFLAATLYCWLILSFHATSQFQGSFKHNQHFQSLSLAFAL